MLSTAVRFRLRLNRRGILRKGEWQPAARAGLDAPAGAPISLSRLRAHCDDRLARSVSRPLYDLAGKWRRPPRWLRPCVRSRTGVDPVARLVFLRSSQKLSCSHTSRVFALRARRRAPPGGPDKGQKKGAGRSHARRCDDDGRGRRGVLNRIGAQAGGVPHRNKGKRPFRGALTDAASARFPAGPGSELSRLERAALMCRQLAYSIIRIEHTVSALCIDPRPQTSVQRG